MVVQLSMSNHEKVKTEKKRKLQNGKFISQMEIE